MINYLMILFVAWATAFYVSILYTRYLVPHGGFCTLICKNFNGEYPPNRDWKCWHECEIDSIIKNHK